MTRLTYGSGILWKDELWKLIDIPEVNRVLIRNNKSGQTELVDVTELKGASSKDAAIPGLLAISNENWEIAHERFSALSPLIRKGKRQRSYAEIDAVAERLGTSRVTIYRWLKKIDEVDSHLKCNEAIISE